MITMNDVYKTVRTSNNKQELIEIIRAVVPGIFEARSIICYLESNPIFDSELKLEVASKVVERYRSFEIVDDIIECASNIELMKRLYNADVDKFGAFVAVNIIDQDELERMYMNGTIEVKRAVASNTNTRVEFLGKIIQEATDEQTKKYAEDTLKEISGRN